MFILTVLCLQPAGGGPAGHDREAAGERGVPGQLYCTVLYCTALYCTVLYCTALYFTVKVSKMARSTYVTEGDDTRLHCALRARPRLVEDRVVFR